MKAHSQYFRNNLRGIRELSAVISYRDESDGLYILTQNAENILTEDNYKLITQYKRITYDNNSINRVNVTFNSELFNTICKSVQIETTNKIEQGTVINVRVGVYIEETEDYEFIDLGEYTVLSEPTYQVDTKSYSVIAYDKMYESMVNYDDDPLEITYPITHKNMLIAICNKLGWYHQLNNYPNYDKIITEDIYQGRQMTYRDILNDLNKGCFGCLMFQNNRLILRVPSETGLIIEDADLKDTNINLSEKYGKVNSLYITDKGTVLNFKQDQESIELNGETKLNIADNLLMDSHNSTFINDLFTQVDGLEYTVFDVDSTGLLVLDPLDIVTFRHDGVDYKTIIFNDDISIQDGLTENLFSEKLKEDVSNYYARDDVLKKLTDAYIEIDKANGQIVLKVDNDGKIVQAQLKANPETGSEFNVKADNINFNGKTFNLTSENIKIESNNFSVNSNGVLTCNGATFRDGAIKLNDSETGNDILEIYRYWDNDDGVWKSTIYMHDYDGSDTDIYPGWIRVLDGDGIEYTDIIGGTIECDNLEVRGSKNRLVRISETEGVLLSAYETATPYFGDIGSNKTNEDGYCKIPIDKLFAKTIEIDDYKVFIQECGEGRLYVKKHKNYFEVFGTANLDFDWELKAVQKDYKDVRLQKREMKPLKGDDN